MRRQGMEELGVEIALTGRYDTAHYQYPDAEIDFIFFTAFLLSGQAAMLVHQEIRWVRPQELIQYPFCPANQALIQRLTCEKTQDWKTFSS